MTRINPKIMIGRFCDPVAYRNSRSDIGAEWLPRQIVDVSFLGNIGSFPDEDRTEGDLHPTPEEIGEEPHQIIVPSSIPPLDPNEPIPF